MFHYRLEYRKLAVSMVTIVAGPCMWTPRCKGSGVAYIKSNGLKFESLVHTRQFTCNASHA
eukprot:2260647-Amphidinium_carterae.1